jgi:toxin-antitoxin system PIN domain toxin
VNLVDANVLLYAVNEDSDRHEPSRRWLDASLSGGDTVGFAWVVLLAFVRLVTKEGLFASPLTVGEATRRVDAWLASPAAVVIEPGADHVRRLHALLDATGVGGNLVNDAHLAALALEHRCGIVSYDNDFSRFPSVVWTTPS